jgi:hypothetical protein
MMPGADPERWEAVTPFLESWISRDARLRAVLQERKITPPSPKAKALVAEPGAAPMDDVGHSLASPGAMLKDMHDQQRHS